MPAAVLRASAPMVAAVRRCLPPGHRVVAERADAQGDAELLVEGPLMPRRRRDGSLAGVAMVFRRAAAGAAVTAWWSHAPDRTWTVEAAAGPEPPPPVRAA